MGPRKRLKVSKRKSVEVKRQKKCDDLPESHESDNDLQNNSEKYPALYLSHLPNEVLLCIYQYLSPADMLSLSQLNDRRLSELTFSLREANFSSCRRSSLENVSTYFSRFRVKWIQKLNFNYDIFVKPSDLVQIICRCKNLITLSIVECGIKYHQILHILENCSKLEELAWNVCEAVQPQNVYRSSMKTLYLFCDIQKVSLNSVYYIIKNFPKIENAFINLASDSVLVSPLTGIWLKSSCVSSSELCRRYTLSINSFQCLSNNGDLEFLCKIINKDIYPPGDSPSDSSDDSSGSEKDDAVKSRVYNCPPYLQIQSVEEDILLLSPGPFNAYSTLIIILTPEIVEISESLLKCAIEVAGHKLNHLSLECEAYYLSNEDETPEPITRAEAVVICDLLEKMFLTCKNITVLNMATVHFTIGSPFKAICKLQNLRTLSMSSCAFFKSFNPMSYRGKWRKDRCCEFKEVVSSCPKVENFLLVCCLDDMKQVTEVDMVPIKDWKELKHLSMYSLIFRSCSFLKKVADSCKQLESLSLIEVAPKNACIYVNDVIYLLKTAKNLSFIRINARRFNPMYERFWDAIGEAINLEGICILTQSNTSIDKQAVITGIKKLRYLHLFHFYAPKASDRLYFEAKKSMLDYGVKNIKIENNCNINSFNERSRQQYYHQQPHFCCQHLHLKDIDI